ncbi:spermidine synthase [Corynebacterium ciconiae DSM 44920]|uniref:spermidine synthase n=1 Tax=Corynebacterium ciconiae TaxID=227319 RepID=UPI0003636DAD|nr:fused MFS/spermidine synthase [Corynebacterium ciconiae]WKD61011.1 spermidine synthase [Corynebacterium ciconiae DSM 44920]
MSPRRPRRGSQPSGSTLALAGSYELSHGTAELQYDHGWWLYIDGHPSSHVKIGEPGYLAFEYMRWIAACVDKHVQAHLDPQRLRITHLGGGGCSLPRYFAHSYPRSRNTVVEYDALLAERVRQWFDIPRAPQVKIRVGEAAATVSTFRPDSRDVIIRDCFAGGTVPAPLTQPEFVEHVRGSLTEDGIYLANTSGTVHTERHVLATFFAHTGIIAPAAVLKSGSARTANAVLVASQRPLPAPDVLRSSVVPARCDFT